MTENEMIVPSKFHKRNHLSQFRDSPESYQAILSAIREVLESREILMPFIPEDVYGRHEFLGGRLFQRSISVRITNPSSLSWRPTIDEDLGISQREFWKLFSDEDELVDLTEKEVLKSIKDFCRLASRQGDMIEVKPESRSDEMIFFRLVVGGYDNQTSPKSGHSVFFREHKITLEQNKEKREERKRKRAEKKRKQDEWEKRFKRMKQKKDPPH
jgi:hypothetical protein